MLSTNQTKTLADTLEAMSLSIRNSSMRNTELLKTPDPLTVENARLTNRVAELQAANAGLAKQLQATEPKPEPKPKPQPLLADTRVVLIGRICGYLGRQSKPLTTHELLKAVGGHWGHAYAVLQELTNKGTITLIKGKYGAKRYALASRRQFCQ